MQFSSSEKTFRYFGLLVGVLFPLFLGYVVPILTGHHFLIWTLFVGFSLIILAIFAPKLLRLPYKIWIGIGNFLGFINSRIILGVIFVVLMQPIALIMKIIGYDPIKRKRNSSSSYREVRKNDKIDLDKIF